MKPPLFNTERDLILASASPRRQSFLRELGLQFTVIPANIDETPGAHESGEGFTRRISLAKAKSIGALHPQAAIIGADTVISHQNKLLGKPTNHTHALEILQQLQGTTHLVLTGLSLYCHHDNLQVSVVQTTEVTFGSFPREILEAYIRSGEPMDKAGAYAIQGQGGFLVSKINGSCSNVIGLPMYNLITVLLSHKIISPYGVN